MEFYEIMREALKSFPEAEMNPHAFLAVTADLAPESKRERRLLRKVVDSGCFPELLEAGKTSEKQQQKCREKVCALLLREEDINPDQAKWICDQLLLVRSGKTSGSKPEPGEQETAAECIRSLEEFGNIYLNKGISSAETDQYIEEIRKTDRALRQEIRDGKLLRDSRIQACRMCRNTALHVAAAKNAYDQAAQILEALKRVFSDIPERETELDSNLRELRKQPLGNPSTPVKKQKAKSIIAVAALVVWCIIGFGVLYSVLTPAPVSSASETTGNAAIKKTSPVLKQTAVPSAPTKKPVSSAKVTSTPKITAKPRITSAPATKTVSSQKQTVTATPTRKPTASPIPENKVTKVVDGVSRTVYYADVSGVNQSWVAHYGKAQITVRDAVGTPTILDGDIQNCCGIAFNFSAQVKKGDPFSVPWMVLAEITNGGHSSWYRGSKQFTYIKGGADQQVEAIFPKAGSVKQFFVSPNSYDGDWSVSWTMRVTRLYFFTREDRDAYLRSVS